jgi:PAS domain S-box-containing protein
MAAPLASAPAHRSVEASLLDQAPAAIAVVDPRGRIVYWNRESASLYGWARREAVGSDLLSLVSTQADEADPAFDVLEILGSGTAWIGDLHLRRRDGELLHVRARGRPLMSSRGTQVGVMIVTVPVHEGQPAGAAPLRDDHDLVAIGRRLALARRQAGFTQSEVAQRLGVTKRSLQGYEAGTVAPYRHLPALASILGRDRSWFLAAGSAGETGSVRRRELEEIVRTIVREEVLPALESVRLRGPSS